MEIPSLPVLAEFVLKLRDDFQIHDFVETGTYLGVTARWASRNFPQVYTVEASKDLWERAVKSHAGMANIEFLHGDSRTALAGLLPRLISPTIFWLDAHWSAGVTFGKEDQCPLLGELDALRSILKNAFVLIDDANLFLSPPPRPNSLSAWPDIYTVLHTLKQDAADNYVLVFENVVISVPAHAQSSVASFCQDFSTRRFEQKVRAERAFLNRVFFRVRRKLEHTFPALKAK
jgi:hypothetical protein